MIEVSSHDSILSGRRVELRAVDVPDYQYLYRLLTDPAINFRWRDRGVMSGPEAFFRVLWTNVLAQFVIFDRRTGELAGMATALNPDFRNQTVHVALVLEPRFQERAWPLEAGGLLVDYLFTAFPFRKIYGNMPGFNFGRIARGMNRFFREEACLRQHDFHDGKFWDLHILALFRADWEQWKLSGSTSVLRSSIAGDDPTTVTNAKRS